MMQSVTPLDKSSPRPRRSRRLGLVYDIQALYHQVYQAILAIGLTPDVMGSSGWHIHDLTSYWFEDRLYRSEIALLQYNPCHRLTDVRPLNVALLMPFAYDEILHQTIQLPEWLWHQEAVGVDVTPETLTLFYQPELYRPRRL